MKTDLIEKVLDSATAPSATVMEALVAHARDSHRASRAQAAADKRLHDTLQAELTRLHGTSVSPVKRNVPAAAGADAV